MKKLVQINFVKENTSLSKYAIDKLIKEGKFPKPIALTNRILVWRQSEIEKFINDPVGYPVLAEQETLAEQEVLAQNIA